MSLKCGIVGLPNVGKSTLFNALTKAGIAAENYPFCTIEPNVGVVEVPDPRLNGLAEIVKPERILPAIVEFVDIAGLVAGASKGEGLGNQFLSHIRKSRAFTSESEHLLLRRIERCNVVRPESRTVFEALAEAELVEARRHFVMLDVRILRLLGDAALFQVRNVSEKRRTLFLDIWPRVLTQRAREQTTDAGAD